MTACHNRHNKTSAPAAATANTARARRAKSHGPRQTPSGAAQNKTGSRAEVHPHRAWCETASPRRLSVRGPRATHGPHRFEATRHLTAASTLKNWTSMHSFFRVFLRAVKSAAQKDNFYVYSAHIRIGPAVVLYVYLRSVPISLFNPPDSLRESARSICLGRGPVNVSNFLLYSPHNYVRAL